MPLGRFFWSHLAGRLDIKRYMPHITGAYVLIDRSRTNLQGPDVTTENQGRPHTIPGLSDRLPVKAMMRYHVVAEGSSVAIM